MKQISNSKDELLYILKSFDGAKGSKVHLKAQFKEIAEHLLHGGYFLVSGAGMEPYRVYLHTVEFYYHEEKETVDEFKDCIVYHRNRNSRDPKRAVSATHCRKYRGMPLAAIAAGAAHAGIFICRL